MKTVLVLLGCATLCCVPRAKIIPDPRVPHRVAEESEVTIWARRPDGKFEKERIRLLEGWWIAGPPVVDPLPPGSESPVLP